MTDLNDMLAELRALAPEAPTPGQLERTIRQGTQRYRRQKRTRTALAALTAMLVAGTAGTLVHRWRTPVPVTLADGSTVAPLSKDSVIDVTSASPEAVEVRAVRGATRFDVVHDPKRKFQVVAGDVRVEVIGTRFVVAVSDGNVNVRVERGQVRVSAKGVARLVSQGENATFERGRGEPAPEAKQPTVTPAAANEPLRLPDVALPAPADPLATHDGIRSKKSDAAASAWRASAARGNYDAAYGELRAGGARVVRDIPEELMLAADVARWSHHPAEAVPYLERVVREHQTDPRSQLAAFTLGRVLLDELGRPREAASAFGRARALDDHGPLAGDALAREVEAWSRAGDNANALARAEEYLARYPNGPHTASVRRFGRLE